MPDTHRHLVEARNLLDLDGWIQGALHEPGEGRCMAGAIEAVEGRLFGPAYDALCEAVNRPGLSAFNDTEGRTKEEVLAVFDEAIRRSAPEPVDPLSSRSDLEFSRSAEAVSMP